MTKFTVSEPAGHLADINDPLTEGLWSGAQRMLIYAIEAEAEAFLTLMADWKLEDGRARFARRGHGPESNIQNGIGAVPVQRVTASLAEPRGPFADAVAARLVGGPFLRSAARPAWSGCTEPIVVDDRSARGKNGMPTILPGRNGISSGIAMSMCGRTVSLMIAFNIISELNRSTGSTGHDVLQTCKAGGVTETTVEQTLIRGLITA